MAFTSGTVIGHKNLLKTVVDYVTGNAAMGNRKWIIKRNKDNKNENYILEAPGLSGTDKIYFGIKLFQNQRSDYFNWRVTAALAYDASQPTSKQPFAVSYGYLLWDKSIKYWLSASGQRLILVCKVSTIYTILYMGKFLPYAAPGQYPYPVMLCASARGWTTRWSDRTDSHAHLQAPNQTGAVRLPSNIWQNLNSFAGQSAYYGDTANHIHLYPVTLYGLSNRSNNVYKNIKKNPDNSYALIPYLLATSGARSTSRDRNILGELDGMMWVTGDSNASENTITAGGKTYMVVQNIWRTAWHDYCAVIQD